MPLLSVADLRTSYRTSGGMLHAVDGVSFHVGQGETVGLVGESGCGKSTLGKTILRLVPHSGGQILFDGIDVASLDHEPMRLLRRRMQMIFQDPFASLNPRQSIGNILIGPLIVHGVDPDAARQRVAEIIERVGLSPGALRQYPHEFSGGQRQRIGIARALVLRPELVVCDEPVSALDLSIQAQILNLLAAMKHTFNLSYLFISHDLSVVRYFTDRVLVMYLGRIVESASSRDLWKMPRHPYTRALMAAVPDPSRRRQAAPLPGDLPSATKVPQGCRFHPRCPLATEVCASHDPALREVASGHEAACHHADQLPSN